jgi:hypothetical protein
MLGMVVDGLATALMVLGEERGPAFAEIQGIAAYFIVREGEDFKGIASTAFQAYLDTAAPDSDGSPNTESIEKNKGDQQRHAIGNRQFLCVKVRCRFLAAHQFVRSRIPDVAIAATSDRPTPTL